MEFAFGKIGNCSSIILLNAHYTVVVFIFSDISGNSSGFFQISLKELILLFLTCEITSATTKNLLKMNLREIARLV